MRYCECAFSLWRLQRDVSGGQRRYCGRCHRYQDPDEAREDVHMSDLAEPKTLEEQLDDAVLYGSREFGSSTGYTYDRQKD